MTDREADEFARRKEDRVESVDIVIAEGDQAEAYRIKEALAPILNRVTILTEAENAADYLLQRGRWRDERRTPDLVLLDADLIGDPCWRFVQKLRQMGRYDETLIAVLSSSPSVEKAERARMAGVNWLVGKPISLETLSDLVEDLEDMGLAVVRARQRKRFEKRVLVPEEEIEIGEEHSS